MAEIAPLAGIRYNTDHLGRDVSSLIAPPYDVLGADDKAALLAKSDRNIVAVDLPHLPPKTPGPDILYRQAAETLASWLADGTLVRESSPALYVYHQQYTYEGTMYTRRMLLARLRLEPFGTGTVFPHEQTYGGPKEERRKLMQATRCQLSPVFGLYSDPEQRVSMALDVGGREPDVTGRIGDVINQVWIERDADRIEQVVAALASKAIYIADGHHRYSTALAYRDELAGAGTLADDHPARFLLIGLCAMEDPGCLILPTHRVLTDLRGTPVGKLLELWSAGWKAVTADPAKSDWKTLLGPDAKADVGLYVAAGNRRYTATFTNRAVLDELASDRSAAWRGLHVAYLHHYMLGELLKDTPLGREQLRIEYTASADEVERIARDANGIAFLVRPTSMEQLRAVSEAGDLMPQKSTFFYPKLATGLVLYDLRS